MDLSTAPRGELVRIIYKQQEQIEALEIRITELTERLKQQDPKQKIPPVWVKPNAQKKKSGPRKKREENYGRKLDIPTTRIFHSYETCPSCGGSLGKPSVGYTRQVIEIPPSPVTITEHVICKRWCFTCKKRVMPRVSFSSTVVGKQRIGIRLMSIIATLREVLRQPIESIQTYLAITHNLHVSQGAIIRLLHKTACRGEPLYTSFKETIRGSPHLHADETGGRENGKNGYFWSFNTNTVHFLLYRKSRGKSVVEEVLGEYFTGVLSTDFYAAYNTYTGFHQRCWVHLLRDIHTLKESYPDNSDLCRWAGTIQDIYEEAKAYPGPTDTLPPGRKEEERIAKQGYFEDKLREICKPWVGQDVPMNVLCSRALKYLQELFVFIRFEGIPSDNNGAERILRHTVVSRKISGGTRSTRGSQTKSILASLFGTWKLQNQNPLTQCQLLLTACQ